MAVAACALIPMAMYAVYRFVKSSEDDAEEPDIPEETQLEPMIGVEKPDIFSVRITSDVDEDVPPGEIQHFWQKGLDFEEESVVEPENEETVEAKPNTIITEKDWLELRKLDGYEDHVVTYFWEDDIFAGVDENLDILDKEESFGGIPADAFNEAKEKGWSYVLCGDGKTLLEICGTDGNYLEELRAVYANV